MCNNCRMAVQKTCLFCQRSGHSKITHEHAWPKWLITRRGSLVENFNKDYQTGELRTWHSKGETAIVTNDVCKECNNGWMSDLEQVAKRIVRPLMSGTLTIWLSVEDQELLRCLIIKSVMMHDSANPAKGRYFAAAERESFWKTRVRPESLSGTVGIGVYAGARHGVYAMMFHRIVNFARAGSTISGHAYCCTLQMERFIAQVLFIRGLNGPGPRNLRADPKWSSYLFPIGMPTIGVYWPVVRSVTDEQLEAFTDRWHIYSSEPGTGPTTLTDF
jgi:hypothetical protein